MTSPPPPRTRHRRPFLHDLALAVVEHGIPVQVAVAADRQDAVAVAGFDRAEQHAVPGAPEMNTPLAIFDSMMSYSITLLVQLAALDIDAIAAVKRDDVAADAIGTADQVAVRAVCDVHAVRDVSHGLRARGIGADDRRRRRC